MFGDILLTKDGANTGNCCINTLHKEFSLLSSVAVLRADDIHLQNNFLIQFIKDQKGQSIIQDAIGGQAITRITLEKIRNFPIIIPPLPEQRRIAAILSTWDEAISKQQQLIDALQVRHRALMQQLLSGKKRLKGFKGKWKEVKLGEIANIRKGEQLNVEFLSKSGSYPAINGGIKPSGYTEEWNTEANTITISEGGNSCGYVNFIRTRFWCGGHCYALLELSERISDLFLFQLLKFHEPFIMALRVGSGLPNIQMKPLETYLLVIPSLAEQIAIASILSTSEKEIQAHKHRLTLLEQQKRGLMQVLLTGKVRVKT